MLTIKMKFKEFIELHRGYDLPEQKRIKGDYMVFASTSVVGSHNEYKVKAPGVVTGRSGSLGEVQFAKQNFWPLNTTLFVSDFKNNLPRYVYYFLKTLNLGRFNTGAGVPTLNRNDLDNLDIHVHLLPEQQKISSILSAYDNLIEINEQRIKILEEMARLIYNEWFVKFRFPGYKKVKMVESELGKIPEGWDVKSIFNITKVRYGKNLPGKKMKKDGNYLVYGAAKVIGKYDKYNCGNATVITGCRGSCGQMKITKPKSFVTNNSFIFDFPEEEKLFFYHQLMIRGLQDYIGGTAQPQITLASISSLKVIVPKEELIKHFNQIVIPIFNQIDLLDDLNTNLCETRDMLLTKLFSGEIDVSDLYINTKE